MSHSIYSADRMTYLKIVVVALTVGVTVVSVGTLVRLSADDGDARTAGVMKADKVVKAPVPTELQVSLRSSDTGRFERLPSSYSRQGSNRGAWSSSQRSQWLVVADVIG